MTVNLTTNFPFIKPFFQKIAFASSTPKRKKTTTIALIALAYLAICYAILQSAGKTINLIAKRTSLIKDFYSSSDGGIVVAWQGNRANKFIYTIYSQPFNEHSNKIRVLTGKPTSHPSHSPTAKLFSNHVPSKKTLSRVGIAGVTIGGILICIVSIFHRYFRKKIENWYSKNISFSKNQVRPLSPPNSEEIEMIRLEATKDLEKNISQASSSDSYEKEKFKFDEHAYESSVENSAYEKLSITSFNRSDSLALSDSSEFLEPLPKYEELILDNGHIRLDLLEDWNSKNR